MPIRRHALGLTVLLVAAGACVHDVARLPAAQWSTRAALVLVHGYQRTASSFMPRIGVRCRFTPTCSRYAEAVLRIHGFPRGGWLAVQRVARCGPWTKPGTSDPPR